MKVLLSGGGPSQCHSIDQGTHRPWGVNNKWTLGVPIGVGRMPGHDAKINTILSRPFAITVGPPSSKHLCASLIIKVFRKVDLFR